MDGLMDEWLHNIFQTGLDTLPEPKIFQRKSVVVEMVPRKPKFCSCKAAEAVVQELRRSRLMLYGS